MKFIHATRANAALSLTAAAFFVALAFANPATAAPKGSARTSSHAMRVVSNDRIETRIADLRRRHLNAQVDTFNMLVPGSEVNLLGGRLKFFRHLI